MLNPSQSVQKYKLTLFDRYGPDAGNILRAFSHGLISLGLAIPLFAAAAFKLVDDGIMRPGVWPVIWMAGCVVTSGCLATLAGLASGGFAGGAWKHLMVNGSSTPYQKQYSIEESMVKRGRIGEALESFETIIREHPDESDAHVKAAELYARNGNPQRALELLRAVQSMTTLEPGQDCYVSYRIVDLYEGPLGDRGRAIVELRRLIDRHPQTRFAATAKEGLARLKAQHIKIDGLEST